VVIPLRDQLVLPDWQRTLAALAEADVIEAEGARHELPMTHPEVVVSAINGRRRPSHPL